MDELCVSASDFRVHLKDLANNVAAGGQRVIMARHGFKLVALVSQEDLAFLRKHRPGVEASAREAAGIPRVLKHPEYMAFEEVERLYRATNDMTDDDIENWRGKASVVIWLKTGKRPEVPPYSVLRRKAPGPPGPATEETQSIPPDD